MLKELKPNKKVPTRQKPKKNAVIDLTSPKTEKLSQKPKIDTNIKAPYVEIDLNSPPVSKLSDNEISFPIEVNNEIPANQNNNLEIEINDQEEDKKDNSTLDKKESKIQSPPNKINSSNKKTKVVPIANYANKAIKKYLKQNKLVNKPGNKSNLEMEPPYKEYSHLEEINPEHQKQMEDFYCINDNIVQKGNAIVSMFSIFDGHGGQSAAIYSKDNFARIVSKAVIACSYDFPKCLSFSFNKLNTDLLSKIKESDIGTTASTVLLVRFKNDPNNRYIYTGNVGDSKIYLLQKSGKSILLSKDHKCDDTSEVERIKNKGGLVFNSRVFGSLMLTRTIGDREMKEYGVICDPYINKHTITEDDNYIIIASDGIWDCISTEDLNIYAGEEDMGAQALCKRLVKEALEKGSTDNISCIGIKL